MTSFLHGGADAYRAVIRLQYKSKLRTLKEKLRLAGSANERCRLAEELRNLKIELRTQLARTGRGLF
jgi:hypothetical protein